MATLFAPADDLDGPEPRPRRYRVTAEDFEAIGDRAVAGGRKLELIDGELFELPPQYHPHARVKSELGFRLRDALRSVGSPLSVVIEVSTKLSAWSVPMPDIVVLAPVEADRALPACAVRLAVEVCLTTHDVDLSIKPELNAGADVPEYWVWICAPALSR